MNWKQIWKWAEHNRFTVIVPVIALVLWCIAVGCTPTARSPVSNRFVDAAQLQIDFDSVMASFELAKADLIRQAEIQSKFTEALLTLASGGVANWSGFLQMLIGGGFLGFAADNIRKSGVIGGLKSK